MSRHRQLRSGRVLCFGLSSLGPLVGYVAEKVKDSMLVERFTYRGGPHSVDFRRVWRMLKATTCPTSMRGRPRPMGGASVRLRHAQLVSRCLGTVRAHGERCRYAPRGTPCDRALCNGRNDLHSPPQSYHEPKRLISEMFMTMSNYLIGWAQLLIVAGASYSHRCSR